MIRKKPIDTKYFKYYNANPADKRAGDCVVRALCLAMDKSWLDVFDGLCREFDTPTTKNVYAKYVEEQGWVMKQRPKQYKAAKSYKYYTAKDFILKMRQYNINIPIIAKAGTHHVICIKNTMVVDIWNSSEEKLGNLWVPREYSDIYDKFVAELLKADMSKIK